jgi:methyl-accepting chemotaxis protein
VKVGAVVKTITSITEQANLLALNATSQGIQGDTAGATAAISEIAGNISGVAEAAATTTEGVAQTRQAAVDLARISAQLQTVVARFRY